MTLLLALAPVAAAQKPEPKPVPTPLPTPEPTPEVHPTPPGSDSADVITIFSNGTPQPNTQQRRADTCLLPPLDSTRSNVIAAGQLRIPTKARREYERACSALTKKKSWEAEQHLRKAVQEYPKYAAAWVTLGQVLADDDRSEDARNACGRAATIDPTYLPAHLCLAEIASRTDEWSEQLKHSKRALALDPNSVLAYEYHAAANANLGNFTEAERSGLRAVELDKEHREPSVFFLLAQIYALKGDSARAEEQFRQYVKYTHNRQGAAMDKQILAKLEKGKREDIEIPESKPAQEAVPPVPDDATCPLSQILLEAGQRETELVENLQRFTAVEQIEYTEFSKNSRPRKTTSERFSYLAEIEQNPYAVFSVYEYRTPKGETDPPPLTDTGTAAMALMFHPKLIGNLEIHCEGRTDLQGTAAWQLRFEEGPDLSKSFSELETTGSTYRIRLKGRAWISADDNQVLRLQTDLVAPMPEINLRVYHFDVAYSPVEFAKHKFRLWLPESASLQIEYRGRRYQRVHSFSKFQLFQVDTEQRVKEPVPSTPKSWLTSNANPIP